VNLILHMHISSVKGPVQVFKSVGVYLSCIWLFGWFVGLFSTDVTFFTYDNLATLCET